MWKRWHPDGHLDYRDGQETLKEDMKMSQQSVPKRMDCWVYHFSTSFRAALKDNSLPIRRR
jgi:hypothetical protein